uniref:Vacuolar protein-sorting-associated protein 36 n=1 Tax=Spongospora subterranea TaxID=70186 RepID=A0A0H5R858_9EUKA|eukprot:CRZ04494.1 hypothetical protein [Spongospora subterranea]
MLMLIDVYCMFNRARGTELISPDDLLHACRLFTELNFALKVREFSSGVLAIQGPTHDDKRMTQTILQIIDSRGPITDIQLSGLLSISIIVAAEHLHSAENAGALCRDTTPEATRFYKNLFVFV